mmetsp:Transcript_31370/g.57586  ORF Transcript_31370/g.57586 Transcript_31370/m.57586 type:complete len:269 (+) Transcript_31370:83-889(+)
MPRAAPRAGTGKARAAPLSLPEAEVEGPLEDADLESIAAARKAARERIEAARRRIQAAEQMKIQANEEKTAAEERVQVLTEQHKAELLALTRDAAEREQELEKLRSEWAAKQRAALETDYTAEHSRRVAADERAMKLRAVLDYIEGEHRGMSLHQLAALVGFDDQALAACSQEGKLAEAQPVVPLDEKAVALLERVKALHKEDLLNVVQSCNEQMQRDETTLTDILDNDGLKRLIAALQQEGALELKDKKLDLRPQILGKVRDALLGT